jgi:catechol 2,3-dioxygenase-like lactoylglutathione lyase family enzyme
MKVERISAVTLKVSNMRRSIAFYRDVLGLKIVFGGEDAPFSTLSTEHEDVLFNLEQGDTAQGWGRIIFYVDDVDACWEYLKDKGFDPERPRDATWNER